MTDHAIPPRELVEQWASEKCYDERDWLYELHIANRAAQWGADQELDACVEWMSNRSSLTEKLRAARRPKPPSLKEQALKELAWVAEHLDMPLHNRCNAIHTIHRALESIND